MFNPLAMASPEQQAKLIEIQKHSRKIRYSIHTDDDKNHVEITLHTDDPEAAKLLPQIQEGIVTSVTQMLYQVFAMNGERV